MKKCFAFILLPIFFLLAFLLTIRLAQGHIYLNGSLLMSIFIVRFIDTNCLDKWDREKQFIFIYWVGMYVGRIYTLRLMEKLFEFFANINFILLNGS